MASSRCSPLAISIISKVYIGLIALHGFAVAEPAESQQEGKKCVHDGSGNLACGTGGGYLLQQRASLEAATADVQNLTDHEQIDSYLTASPRRRRGIQYGTGRFVISATTANHKTSNCGYYGCRVASIGGFGNRGAFIKFDHGGARPRTFAANAERRRATARRRRLGQDDIECMKYGDQISLYAEGESNNPTPSYNGRRRILSAMYGEPSRASERTLRFLGGQATKTAVIDQDVTTHSSFFVRPPGGVSRSGCVQYGQCVVLAYSSQDGQTSNCGWYGCRVATLNGQSMSFGHGGSSPKTWCLQPAPPNSRQWGPA